MVNENKVSTKNAFDLKLIDHMDDIVDSFMGGRKRKAAEPRASTAGGAKAATAKPRESAANEDEHRFLEASCTIEASARIYACRVDCVHSDTYRVLGGLNSADMDEDEGKEGEEGKGDKKRRRIIGVNTLEKNENNIVQQNIEADEQSDPSFRRMAAQFDAGGAKGLLLSHLPLAEDLSLVFIGDVPMKRAAVHGLQMFEAAKAPFTVADLNIGDAGAACDRIQNSRLCPEVDQFRRQLTTAQEAPLPAALEALLGNPAMGVAAVPLAAATSPAALQDGFDASAADFGDGDMGGDFDGADMGLPDPAPMDEPAVAGESFPFGRPSVSYGGVGSAAGLGALPLSDLETPFAAQGPPRSEDAIAFDELFDKFCGGAEQSQFAYFDECWDRLSSRGKEAKEGQIVLADGQADAGLPAEGVDGTLVAATEGGARGRQSKRPLFDLSALERPLKPIEYEPAHKHQLSERAAHWQLHKDVPPYMIDRITMPSWPSWSRCDFASLGLRPHLMLKLVKKPQPPGEGPHSFAELFSTVVVENPDAFPWLAGGGGVGGLGQGDDDFEAGPRAHSGDDDGGEEDFDGSGLPAHLDVNPQDLFFQPGDKVIPGCDQDGPDLDAGDDGDVVEAMDFDMVDKPATCGDSGIAYSRNSKFVDVRLVKKHLWDCMSDDITRLARSPDGGQVATASFQGLINRTVQRMPKSECENLSLQVCFICALHLCNEKGLEFKVDPSKPLGDFEVIGPPPNGAAAPPPIKAK